jgi:hypothetical protein
VNRLAVRQKISTVRAKAITHSRSSTRNGRRITTATATAKAIGTTRAGNTRRANRETNHGGDRKED